MNIKMTIGSLITALTLTTVNAATPNCSIHPAKDATDAQLASLAKVSQAAAEKKALAHVKSPAKVVGSELQVEDGCLFWTLIVKVGGKAGMEALKVDAGTGKLMLTQHESGK